MDTSLANGIPLGYKVIVYDSLREESHNYTVNASVHEMNFENLFPYTSYEIRIQAFTIKGEGNTSTVLAIRTEEDGKSPTDRQKRQA